MAARAAQEMQINQQRHEHELAMKSNQQVLAAQEHAQGLAHKQQAHKQNMKHQRELAAAREAQLNQQPEEPTE